MCVHQQTVDRGRKGPDLTHSACDPSLRTVALHWQTCAGRRWRQDSAARETADSTSEGQHLTVVYHFNLFLNFNIWRLSQVICIKRHLKRTIFDAGTSFHSFCVQCVLGCERKSKLLLISSLCSWITGETFSTHGHSLNIFVSPTMSALWLKHHFTASSCIKEHFVWQS